MNEAYFNNLVRSYPNLQGIMMQGTRLVMGHNSYELQQLNLADYFNKNIYICASLDKITPQDFFSILKTEDIALQNQKLNSKNEVEMIQQMNPNIKNIGLITQKDEYGIDRNYVHYVDEQGTDFILYQDAPGDLLRTYQELLVGGGERQITEKDLFDALNRKMKNVRLDSFEELQNTSETFSDALKSLNQDAGSLQLKGNADHQIAVVNHVVYKYQKDRNGNLVQTQYSLNQEEKTFSQEQKQDAPVEEVQKQEEVLFISEAKFYELVLSQENISEEDQKQVDLFYGFLSDVMMYQDYLSEETKGFLKRYEAVICQIEVKSSEQPLLPKEEEMLNKFIELCERKRTEDLSQEKADGLQRTLTNPRTTGSFLGSAIVLCAILLGIVIAWVMMKS